MVLWFINMALDNIIKFIWFKVRKGGLNGKEEIKKIQECMD